MCIATNGKIDDSWYFDMPTQKLSAHLPLLLHSTSERVAVIGLGTHALQDDGIFAHWLQIYDMETEDVRSVIAAFDSVFPNTYVAVSLLDTDLLLIDSKQPVPIDSGLIDARMEQ